MKKLRILSVLLQELKMRPLLDDMPIINYQDPIGKCCIGKSMGNGNRALALAQMIQLVRPIGTAADIFCLPRSDQARQKVRQGSYIHYL